VPRFDLRTNLVEDLQELADVFEPLDRDGNRCDVDGAVELPRPFAEGVNRGADVPEPTAVWTFTGRHVGPLLGFDATGEVVTITGITVFRRPEDTESGEVECYRSIDWLDVLGQIGVVLHHRSIPEVLDQR
jgi:hypothetical protein